MLDETLKTSGWGSVERNFGAFWRGAVDGRGEGGARSDVTALENAR